jgi:hypothetical protein
MANLKELIKNYIKENYIKEEQASDVTTVINNLQNIQDTRFLQSLRGITTLEEAQQLLVFMIDFINAETPAPTLDASLAIQAINNIIASTPEDEKEEEIGEPEEEEVDEISTSAGAGAYNTKYAFKLPKKDKDKE